MRIIEHHTKKIKHITSGFLTVFSSTIIGGILLLILGKANDTLTLNGSLKPMDAIILRAPRDGRIQLVKVESGNMVHRGDTLFILDRSPVELQIIRTRSKMREIRNRIDCTRTLIRVSKSSYYLRLREAECAIQKSRYRLIKLFEEKCIDNGIDPAEADIRRPPPPIANLADFKLRRAELELALAELDATRADSIDISTRRAELTDLEGQLKSLSFELSYYRKLWDESVILSPKAGYVVGRRLAELQGAAVKQGDILCRVGNCLRWQLECKAPGKKLGLLRKGARARVYIEPASGGLSWEWHGVISFIASAPLTSGNPSRKRKSAEYSVIIDLKDGLPEDRRLELAMGRNARARIILGTKPLYTYLIDRLLHK